MITIIHGDNTAESRKFLQTFKEEKLPLVLVTNEVNLTDLAQIFEGSSLFFEQKIIVIEDYLSKTRKSKEKDAVLAYLSKHGKEHEIIFWDGKLLTKSQFSGLSNPIERQFKLPQTLFQFLDNIKPDNKITLLKLFHETERSTEPELLFHMIVRHFRMMMGALSQSKIDELKRAGDWQITKYKHQAQLFGAQKLRYHYKALFDIERKQKTGTLSSDLTATIDFFLLSI